MIAAKFSSRSELAAHYDAGARRSHGPLWRTAYLVVARILRECPDDAEAARRLRVTQRQAEGMAIADVFGTAAEALTARELPFLL